MTKASAALLLIDSDLGFTFWLAHALERVGYECLPANSAMAAEELIKDYQLSIDIVVMDPLSQDALRFLFSLEDSRPGLKTVAVLPPEAGGAPDLAVFDAVKQRPQQFTSEEAEEWVDLIRGISHISKPRQMRVM